MKLLTVDNYCDRHNMTVEELFYRAWIYYHGKPTPTEERSIAKDMGLWHDTRSQPQYVFSYLREE